MYLNDGNWILSDNHGPLISSPRNASHICMELENRESFLCRDNQSSVPSFCVTFRMLDIVTCYWRCILCKTATQNQIFIIWYDDPCKPLLAARWTVAAITGDCEKYSIVKNSQSCRRTLASHTGLLDVLFLQIVIKCTTLNTNHPMTFTILQI